jgi:serine protease AprX
MFEKPNRRRFTAGLAIFLLCCIGLSTSARAQADDPPPPAPVSEHLQRQLDDTPAPISFLVILRDQLDVELTLATAPVDLSTRADRAKILYRALTVHARTTQAELRKMLAAEGASVRPFYIVNMLEVTGDADLVARLRTHPDVARLVANPTVVQSHLGTASVTATPSWLRSMSMPASRAYQTTIERPWGLDYTGAPELWEAGITGAGIVIASQDTGVQWDHPALRDRYRGWDAENATFDHVYNWYDAWADGSRPSSCSADAQVPCDDHGHGTHTVGTMLGNPAGDEPVIGMAPDATWIGCRNMENGNGTPASYTACFEFFLAPYPQNGDPMIDGRPDLAPHIINNSWGCPPSEGCDVGALRQVVETVRAAGQFVVASAGNKGFIGCESVVDPIAVYDASFSIGAHDSTGSLATFSSRGPVTIDGSGRIKPDLAAPGVSVYSAWVNDAYMYNQGTSMASPHAAGAAALLWSAAPELMGRIDLTEQVLVKSASPVNATICNPSGTAAVPNNLFGFGRLNAARAVDYARLAARVELTVLDEAGLPLAGAVIELVDQLTGYRYGATADREGAAVVAPIYAGSYMLEISGGGTIPPVPLEIPLGESHGPRTILVDGGTAIRYTVTVPSIMEEIEPEWFLPIVAQP